MDILLRQVLIIDPSSPFHQQQADIFIQNGIISEIGEISRNADKVITHHGLYISPGWVDIFSNFCDPGFEFKETMESGSMAAAAGGYTDVFLIPNTYPVMHNKSGIEYLAQKGRQLPVHIHPVGAITKNAEGKELAEMYDMQKSGAIAFSDGSESVQSSGILLKALQYLKAIDKTIIQVPDDRSINPGGLMNEGITSTRLGLPGRPSIAEELMIARDIELVEYTDSKIHFTGISTAASVALIKKAKERKLAVSCSVTPYHLYFCDEDLSDYDTNLKVNPPLRSKKDRDALKNAVAEGIIDCIATHHMPQESDHKMVEFEYANFGMTGLETSLAMVVSSMPTLAIEQIINLFCHKPRTLFGLPIPTININQTASLTLFDPSLEWIYEQTSSKSRNSPMFGKKLKGKPVGIINKDNLFLKE